jgi:hypothetical protein
MVGVPALEAKLKAFSKRSKISDVEIIDCLVLHKNDVDIPLTTWRRATSLCCRICQQQNIDIKSQLLLLLFNSASILATQEHHFSLVYLFSFQDNI